MIPVIPPEGIPISIFPLSASYANTLTVCAEPEILIVVVVPGTNDPTTDPTVNNTLYLKTLPAAPDVALSASPETNS